MKKLNKFKISCLQLQDVLQFLLQPEEGINSYFQ